MSFKIWFPYGLKSIIQCATRATLLSQPTDIPEFLLQYLAEMINFRKSHPEADPRDVTFLYQELWEKDFQRKMKGITPINTAETASMQVPSQAEIEEAVKMLYTDLVSSIEHIDEKLKKRGRINAQSEKDKKSAATPIKPTPPPCVGRPSGENVPPPFLVVKGERQTLPPPSDVTMKTRRVSSVRCPTLPLSKETTDDVRKMPEIRQPILPPIQKKSSTPADVSASKARGACMPSKLSHTAVPIVTHKLVLPKITQNKTRGKDVSPEPGKGSPVKKKVAQEKSSSRSPASRTQWQKKARPETPQVQEPEEKKIQRNVSPERSRGRRVLWTERARVKPVAEKPVLGISATAKGTTHLNLADVNSSTSTCPHFAHVSQIIKYRHIQKRSTQDHSGLVGSHHYYQI
ncbi:uncharacterized protein [Trachinotus anak]|uniref:uncharacterized protein n=1 Tax=Trachinotus anak TaxID=443729 RepID=UPI0039F24099